MKRQPALPVQFPHESTRAVPIEEEAGLLMDLARLPESTLEEIAEAYAGLLTRWGRDVEGIFLFAPVNEIIEQRWGRGGLNRIKRIAWNAQLPRPHHPGTAAASLSE